MSQNKSHYCTLMIPTPSANKTKAALLNDFKWEPGTEVKVSFLEGPPELQQRVRRVAQEWTGPQMANLTLRFVDDDEAAGDIRVAFQPGRGSWSYLGTYCQQVPRRQPTMNFGWLTADSSDEELRRVVLHEFGHALGLIHEHQNPDRPIAWNRAAVTSDLSGPPNYWDPDTIERNIFHRYEADQVTSTPVDANSIMMYPVPSAWTLDGFSADLNGDLSGNDKTFIRSAYPW